LKMTRVNFCVISCTLCALTWHSIGQRAHAGNLTVDAYGGNYMSTTYTGSGPNNGTNDQDTFGTGNLNGTALDLYCVDLSRGIPVDGTIGNGGGGLSYTYPADSTHDGMIFGSSVPNAGAVSWLLDHYAAGAAANSDAKLGLQAAIWKVEYGAAFTLNQLPESAPGTNDPGTTTAATWNAYTSYYTDGWVAAGSPTDPYAGVSNIYWISPHDASGQLQGIVGYTSEVPEPSSLALLGFGCSVLFVVMRRRRRSAT
jgi:hypothetical protein